MRTKSLLTIGVLLALSVLLVLPASAATLLGSVALAKLSGGVESDLTTDPPELVGAVVISNPGLEKTITQHIPPFTLPIVIDAEGSGPSLKQLKKNLDAVMLLTNPSGTASLTVNIHVWDADGTELTPAGGVSQTLGAHATKAIRISDLLP